MTDLSKIQTLVTSAQDALLKIQNELRGTQDAATPKHDATPKFTATNTNIDFTKIEPYTKKILKEKPTLTYDFLLKAIGEKKNNVGAGFLTDQGAIFLVAKDLGVNLDENKPVASDPSLTKIRDLRDGQKKVDVEAMVMTVGFPQVANLRTGEQKNTQSITIGDETGETRITLWEDAVGTVKVGERVRIKNGFTSSYQGKVQLNIGRFGALVKQ